MARGGTRGLAAAQVLLVLALHRPTVAIAEATGDDRWDCLDIWEPWSREKEEWCRQERGLVLLHVRDPPYDCGAGFADVEAKALPCQDGTTPECQEAINWAKEAGIYEHPDWYPKLSKQSTPQEFKAHLVAVGDPSCSRPCDAGAFATEAWLAKKAAWCCENEQLGCHEEAKQTTSESIAPTTTEATTTPSKPKTTTTPTPTTPQTKKQTDAPTTSTPAAEPATTTVQPTTAGTPKASTSTTSAEAAPTTTHEPTTTEAASTTTHEATTTAAPTTTRKQTTQPETTTQAETTTTAAPKRTTSTEEPATTATQATKATTTAPPPTTTTSEATTTTPKPTTTQEAVPTHGGGAATTAKEAARGTEREPKAQQDTTTTEKATEKATTTTEVTTTSASTSELKTTKATEATTTAEAATPAEGTGPSCVQQGLVYLPLMMAGSARTVEADIGACQERCAETQGCAHFSFWAEGGQCFLQDASAVSTSHEAYSSGPPRCGKPDGQPDCLQDGVAYYPIDMMGAMPTVVATATECQDLCRGSTGCAYFSYHRPSRLCHFEDRSAQPVSIKDPYMVGGAAVCGEGAPASDPLADVLAERLVRRWSGRDLARAVASGARLHADAALPFFGAAALAGVILLWVGARLRLARIPDRSSRLQHPGDWSDRNFTLLVGHENDYLEVSDLEAVTSASLA